MRIRLSHLSKTYAALISLAIIVAIIGFACSPAAALGRLPASGSGSTSVATTSLTSSSAPTSSAPLAAPLTVTDFTAAVRDVSQLVKPAVVQITNEQVQPSQFNQPFTFPAGVGSGVIYDNQGHILTNNHVIDGAQQLLVALPDGRTFDGKVVGADPLTDLAVIQISGSNLPVATFGDSTKMQVGDWVVAIGNALALDGGPTVTTGVVSAMNRAVQEPASTTTPTPGPGFGPGASSSAQAQGPFLFDLIQTDAPINPGNSGGPLVNLNGEVIGINTLIAGQAEPGVPAQGIGFAISINTAKNIADQLVANGKVAHPFLGISYTPLNPSIAAHLGTNQTQGALVSSVVAGSPAASAGVQAQDIITAIDNTPLKTDSDLAQIIDQHKPGDTVTLTIIRNGQQVSLKVTLGQR